MQQFNIEKVRQDFPILTEKVYGKPLVYLDNGATTQKPQAVIDALTQYYATYNSNVHRGVHFLSQKATDAEEAARRGVQAFIHAAHEYEIIFTKGTTDSINLVAYSFAKKYVRPGDEIIVSEMEHHSNIVPWQMACEDRGATLKVWRMNEKGVLDLADLDTLITDKTKMLAVTWVSNTLGTVNPIADIVAKAHQHDVPVLVDAAQAIQHLPIDVQALDIDFLVFSGHKIYGPTGIGVLYGKEKWLQEMPPYQGGGSMIKSVQFSGTTYTDLPFRFEAGTPNIAGAIGLHAALNYVQDIGLTAIAAYEHELLVYAQTQLAAIPGLRFIGEAPEKSATISFLIGDLHPFDVGELLDKQGIAVRTGHHCCQPIMDKFGIPGTIRASLSFYNTKGEIDALISGLQKAVSMLS
ncbi:cysteine desulfurase CsdA [Taibaiella sp. KBW10]|uniref:aminotransferase class V-fold PLP-dependent enzyme n=1 Tax=Taibaiella sp. KBW10 TaxID=2153357 RepID=UPI000F59D382|nr:cysteine desulfurase [Taibaiella sp. KBW10]RQO31974.1 cysteine desulfurase CsdA [Taibaiella sp. KBW10]